MGTAVAPVPARSRSRCVATFSRNNRRSVVFGICSASGHRRIADRDVPGDRLLIRRQIRLMHSRSGMPQDDGRIGVQVRNVDLLGDLPGVFGVGERLLVIAAVQRVDCTGAQPLGLTVARDSHHPDAEPAARDSSRRRPYCQAGITR